MTCKVDRSLVVHEYSTSGQARALSLSLLLLLAPALQKTCFLSFSFSDLDVLELKHVPLDECAANLLIGPCDEQLVVVVSLGGREVKGR